MNKANFFGKLPRVKDFFYQKLFKINDTPQKVALGFGLGVFAGILPGTGPLAALFLAFIFKANRASALIGSFLTNTWLSFVTFLLAIRIGSAIFRVSWQALKNEWVKTVTHLTWQGLFSASILKTILPVISGYFIISFCLGVISYLIALVILKSNPSNKCPRRP